MQYTLIKNNKVINVIEADEAFILANYDDHIAIEGNYPIGYLFQEGYLVPPTKLTPTRILTTTAYVAPSNAPVKTITSITVSDKTTNPVINTDNKYYAQVGFTPLVELTLSDLNINISLVKIPLTKYADDEPTTTELYLTGAIVNGVLTCGGEPVISGNYKVTAARTNRALDRLSGGTAAFHVEFDDIDFLV